MSELLLDIIPPHNLDAEQEVLGAILLDNKAIRQLDLLPDDFYKPAHQKIFTAMQDIMKLSEPIELITLTEKLSSKGQLNSIGGASYLSSLMGVTPTSANIKYHGKIVKEKAHRRSLMKTAQTILNTIHNGELDEIRQTLKDGVNETRGKTKIITARALAEQSIKYIERIIKTGSKVTGVASGFVDLDEHTGGFRPGELIILAARPGMGKTALSDNIALNIAMDGNPVGIFSLEMSDEQSANRHISNIGSIPSQYLRSGKMGDIHFKASLRAAGRLADLPMHFCFDGVMTVHQIWDHVEEMVEKSKVKMVFIDYLQLMQDAGESNRERAISHMSRTLKQMAKNFGIPIMCLSQLNRSVELRQNKRPMLYDLRESGAIEQDADVVMFLYRDGYYDAKAKNRGVAEIILAKGRNFQVCTKELLWQEDMTRFKDLTRKHGMNELF